MSLDDLVRDVANLRASRDRFAADLKLREEKFQEENACLIADLSERKEELMRAEEELRAAVLAASEDEVKVTFGVGIRNVKTIKYDEDKAFEMAKKVGVFLSLDKKSFEAAMKATKERLPDFVIIETVPQATIAKDLSKVLE